MNEDERVTSAENAVKDILNYYAVSLYKSGYVEPDKIKHYMADSLSAMLDESKKVAILVNANDKSKGKLLESLLVVKRMLEEYINKPEDIKNIELSYKIINSFIETVYKSDLTDWEE